MSAPYSFFSHQSINVEKDTYLTNDNLDPGVLHHMKVLRIRAGEKIQLLDGTGKIFLYECLQSVPQVKLSFISLSEQKTLKPHIKICLSPPKGEALWQAVQQITEAGASELCFFQSDFCQWSKQQKNPYEKAKAISLASLEQCQRAWILKIDPHWAHLESIAREKAIHIVCDEDERMEKINLDGLKEKILDLSMPINLYIGPEGGWSPDEREFFNDHQFHKLSLGPLILRVPTACVAALTLLRLPFEKTSSDL